MLIQGFEDNDSESKLVDAKYEQNADAESEQDRNDAESDQNSNNAQSEQNSNDAQSEQNSVANEQLVNEQTTPEVVHTIKPTVTFCEAPQVIEPVVDTEETEQNSPTLEG
jgi:hypothetical protein